MTDASKPRRLRFSLKTLIALTATIAFLFSGWLVYSRYRIQQLLKLRQQGAIVIVRDQTPAGLKAIGLDHMTPFYDVPTVELYVTPSGNSTSLGSGGELLSTAEAEAALLEQIAVARSYGAEDIQLIMIDSFDPQWFKFAEANGLASIGDKKTRYLKRLQANQEKGANINP